LVTYFVFYRGEASNASAFIERYRAEHVPLLAAWPGIENIVLHAPIAWNDPQGVVPGTFAMIVEMTFADADALSVALRSDARAAARSDMTNFPPFEGEIWHQAMHSERLL
jgi:uncharacterized protein (TIGR02118 family)